MMFGRLARLLVAVGLSAAMVSGNAGEPALGQAFEAARLRGELIVGIADLAPAPVAGAKIRTPERLDAAVAAQLAQRLNLPLRLRQVSIEQAGKLLDGGQLDAVLFDRASGPDDMPGESGGLEVATAYVTQPKAVIRSDTALRNNRDIAGRRVCVAQAALAAQGWAARHGATVLTYAVPSDALVAVREGRCDLGFVDDAVWTPLMRFPEWRAFSASLPVKGERLERRWLLSAQSLASQSWLQKEMRVWKRHGVWQTLGDQWARDVAFDVYMDQEVPDCHG